MVKFTQQYPDDSPNPWITRSEQTVYENPWIRVSHREVLNPSGGQGIYGVVHFKNIAVPRHFAGCPNANRILYH